MTPSTKDPMLIASVERQQEYVDEQEKTGGSDSIVFVKAFVNGMRDLGYKSPPWAIAEMIDNSIQANAGRVEVVFGYDPKKKSPKKPDHLAVVDDGVGMIPEMISYAVRWGALIGRTTALALVVMGTDFHRQV